MPSSPLWWSALYKRFFITLLEIHPQWALKMRLESKLQQIHIISTIPTTQLDRVQRLQNWAARLVFQVSRDHPSQPLFNSLHWLPLKQRIIFRLLLSIKSLILNQAPKYLDTCLNSYTPTRSLRSSSDPLRLTYSVTSTLAGDRTFTVSASKYWNDLSLAVIQSSLVSAFRKALQTHHFSSLQL